MHSSARVLLCRIALLTSLLLLITGCTSPATPGMQTAMTPAPSSIGTDLATAAPGTLATAEPHPLGDIFPALTPSPDWDEETYKQVRTLLSGQAYTLDWYEWGLKQPIAGDPHTMIAVNNTVWISYPEAGAVYIADFEGNIIKKLGKLGQGEGEMIKPFGMALYGDKVYIMDTDNARVQVWSSAGDYLSVIPIPQTIQSSRLSNRMVASERGLYMFTASGEDELGFMLIGYDGEVLRFDLRSMTKDQDDQLTYSAPYYFTVEDELYYIGAQQYELPGKPGARSLWRWDWDSQSWQALSGATTRWSTTAYVQQADTVYAYVLSAGIVAIPTAYFEAPNAALAVDLLYCTIPTGNVETAYASLVPERGSAKALCVLEEGLLIQRSTGAIFAVPATDTPDARVTLAAPLYAFGEVPMPLLKEN